MRRFMGRVFALALATMLCLTPITAVIVLGWLSRKTAGDIRARLDGEPLPPWPSFIWASSTMSGSRWMAPIGSLIQNLRTGLIALVAVFVVTMPFSLAWQAGWIAGWEISFSKGYESAGLWPSVSFVAVLFSLPALAVLPMLIAHQAFVGTLASAFDWRRILTLFRLAGWRYILLTVAIAIACIGTLGVRGLPVFAEHLSERVASGVLMNAEAYAFQFKLGSSALLVVSLVVLRHWMVRTYTHAIKRDAVAKPGMVRTLVILACTIPTWAFLVFLVYLAQFLNYSWISWVNQPVLMLPWFGILGSG